ncbi:MAG: hypothetical protein WCD79_00835 [Chthoniobacteraceae bacterium]
MNPDIDILQLPNAWQVVEGFPQPDWKLIGDHIRQTAEPEHLKEAWDKASLQWLGVIKEKLGPDNLIFGSQNFLLLSKKSKISATYLLNVAENALVQIRNDLKDLAWRWEFGRHAIIIFEDLDEYYRYISHFYPDEGEFITSAGIFLNRGYCHTAMSYQKDYTLTLIHELTHLSVAHLSIPRWLNEGLATSTEEKVTGRMSHRLDGETLDQHEAYWNHDTIQDFWSGKSFRIAGDPSKLSYGLAEILVNNMRSDFGSDVHRFVLAAKRDDAGESAALEHLGVSLGEVAATFLGDGDWTPVAGAIAE